NIDTTKKQTPHQRRIYMGAKSRILALKLLEKQKKHPEYAKQIGVEVKVNKNEKVETNRKQYNGTRSGFL
ncbi:MAG: hypothetical protein IKC20_02170, partial [Clostridia bacterium]|nr:hypothetical protein [Clostridia bacterium]